MDEETQKFLILIVNSIARAILWLIGNLFFGMYLGWAFFENSPSVGNIVYYAISILSFWWIFSYLKKKWSAKM